MLTPETVELVLKKYELFEFSGKYGLELFELLCEEIWELRKALAEQPEFIEIELSDQEPS